jgi:hypothetical protein
LAIANRVRKLELRHGHPPPRPAEFVKEIYMSSLACTAIRQLFLHPRAAYPVGETASLLDVGWRDVRGWIESGELAAVDTEAGLVVPWAELVSLGMERWSQAVVEEALGDDLPLALPELVRLSELRLRVRRLDIVALEQLAASGHESVSQLVSRELRDLLSAHSEWLATSVPGFAEALAWPERP